MARINIIGIPTEAGTHSAGPRLTPQAILNASLPRRLHKLGYHIKYTTADLLGADEDATAAARWQACRKAGGVRNEEGVDAVLESVYEELFYGDLELELDGGDVFSIFLGGDATILQPVMAALSAETDYHRRDDESSASSSVGLIYMASDVGLILPAEAAARPDNPGTLDSMVMTHLTQRPGGAPSMYQAPFSSRPDGGPLVTSKNAVLFGFDPAKPAPAHWAYLLENGFKALTRPTVEADPAAVAKKTLDWLEEGAKGVNFIVLHLDVGVIDSGEFPLASRPHYGGLSVDRAFAAVDVFLRSPKVRAMTIAAVDASRDLDGSMMRRFVEALVRAFAGRRGRNGEPRPLDELGKRADKRSTFGVSE